MRFILVMCAVALGACAAHGTKVDQSELEGFQVGETRKAEVLAELGPPSNHIRSADGTSQLSYSYVQVQMQPQNFIPIVGPLLGGSESEHTMVTLSFDERDVLEDYYASEGTGETGTGLISGQKQ